MANPSNSNANARSAGAVSTIRASGPTCVPARRDTDLVRAYAYCR